MSILLDSDVVMSTTARLAHGFCSRSTPWVWVLSGPVACGYVVPLRLSVRVARSMACQVIYLSLAQHIAATIVGSLDTQGVEKEGIQHTRHSGTKRMGMMRIVPPQDLLACVDKLDRWNLDNDTVTNRLVPTSFMNIITSEVFQSPSVPVAIVSSVLPIVCREARDTKSAY